MVTGVTRSMTAGRAWRRTSHGHYVPSAAELTPAQRIVESSVHLPPSGAVAGWAAAYVCGVDWLDGINLNGAFEAVPLCVGPEVRRRSTTRVSYVRDHLQGNEVTPRHGLQVTSPLRTAFDTARWTPSLSDCVVALDAVTHFGLVDLASLCTYVAQRRKWAGLRQLRAALPLVEASVRSPWESRLRMVYVLEAGLPRPYVNQPVFDTYGRFVAIPDLLDQEAGLAVEYDGSGHRERAQHNRDNVREEAMEDVGLIVVRADSYDMRHRRAELLERLLAARRRGLSRVRTRDRWTLQPPSWAIDPYAGLSDEDKDALFGQS
jgi:hypothetical protein